MHLRPEKSYNFDSIRKNFARFRELGLTIHITELDGRIDLEKPEPTRAAQRGQQARNYYAITKLCLSEPACTAMSTWVLTDKYHYRSKENPSWGDGGLFDADLNPKNLYFELLRAFEK